MKGSRRQFLKGSGAVAAGFVGLERFLVTAAQGKLSQKYNSELAKYGKLIPDPARILDLPEGFTYKVISITGDPMSDGLRTPGGPDGMAAFPGKNGRVVLVRNHELDDNQTFLSPFGIANENLSKVDPTRVFDLGNGVRPQIGGTTNVVFNPKTLEVEKQFLSLAGTARNCAGGPTPWNTWITCEETVIRPKNAKEIKEEKKKKKREQRMKAKEAKKAAESAKKAPKKKEAKAPKKKQAKKKEAKEQEIKDLPKHEDYLEHDHGYNFEVPATSKVGLCKPVPLKDMGRFNHEAVAVDPASGIVYQTEDRDDGLVTRYIPKEPGNLKAGGTLQALVIKDKKSCDTRNWPETGEAKIPVGEPLEVEWMTLEDIHSPNDTLRKDAFKAGAARFARGEGMWYGNNQVYFACTSGGIAKSGQIFVYRPNPAEGTEEESRQPGTVTLYLEPNDTSLLEYGDNLTVAPWGDVVLSEDGAKEQYIRGVTPNGEIYTLARSAYLGNSELCGVCFAPNHPTLFVNIQKPGITLAITGPWETLTKV